MSDPMEYDRGHDDHRDPYLLCPCCEHSEGETLCPRCADSGIAKCESCDEYHRNMTPATLACGCVDDVPLCPECRDSQASEECMTHSRQRKPLEGVDFPAYIGKGGGL